MFICEEVDAAYSITLYDANKVSEQLYFWFRVVEKQHQNIILGFDWF